MRQTIFHSPFLWLTLQFQHEGHAKRWRGVARGEGRGKRIRDLCGGALTMQWTYECLVFDMLVPDMMETMALLTI